VGSPQVSGVVSLLVASAVSNSRGTVGCMVCWAMEVEVNAAMNQWKSK